MSDENKEKTTLSEKTGKVTAKVIKGLVAAPKATGRKFVRIGHDLSEGYREVIPAKPPKEKKQKAEKPSVVTTA